jgi:branched-chain amino acid transport system ATP-binding protein
MAEDNLVVATKVRKEFGGLIATDDVDFTIPRGAIVSLIGPNGAGKTTFFNQLTGVYKPTSGSILFDGTEVSYLPPHAITKLGIGRTFQNIRLFEQMSAVENVLVGMNCRLHAGIVGAIFRPPRVKREEAEAREKARELLLYCGLPRRHEERSGSLPYGDQRRLEVARALATEPKLLLLDEPTAGMNPQETAEFTSFVSRVRDEKGVTVLLIEHDMKVVMGVSERITVLEYGAKIAEGAPAAIRADERVIEAYLGHGAGRTG